VKRKLKQIGKFETRVFPYKKNSEESGGTVALRYTSSETVCYLTVAMNSCKFHTW
jgi:hypothetical protein